MADAIKLYDEGQALKDEGKYDEAIAKMLESIEADPQYVLPHLGLGILYGLTGKHEEAVKHAEKACEIEPSDPYHFTTLSIICQRAWAGTQDMKYIQQAEDATAKAGVLGQG